jgi:hypothetical protein
MQNQPQLDSAVPSVVRLGFGASVLVLGAHIVLAGFRGLLNVWVALTPSQDARWKSSRVRI